MRHHTTTLCLLILGLVAVTAAQIPVTSEPRHRVVFEHAQFRILDVNIPADDTTLDHSHDRDVVTVSMSNGADTRVQSPGQPWSAVRPRRPLGNTNVTEYAGKPGSHRIENVGTTPYQLFAVENLRQGDWSTAAPLTAAATTLATEARAFRVYDVRLVPNLSQTSHTHRAATIAVLVSGQAISEGAEGKPDAKPAMPVGLKQLVQPGQWVFVPQGESHHLVRFGVRDAHIVEIELR